MPVRPLYEQLKMAGVLVRYMNYAVWGYGLRISVGSDEQIDAAVGLLARARLLEDDAAEGGQR